MTGARSRIVALAACALGAAHAGAAQAAVPAGAVYTASGGVATTVTWVQEGAGYPRACREWTRSEGHVRVRAVARGPFTLVQLRGAVFGGMQTEGSGKLDVERKVGYRIHDVGVTRDCFPCGPDSEFGDCGEAIPDVVGSRRCAPAATRASVSARVDGGALTVQALARSAEILKECAKLVPRGVALGPPEPRLQTVRFAGAARRIAALAPGESTRFRKATERGADCRPRARGAMRTCTRHLTEVTVRRLR